jgi:hypothetical protein
VSKEYFILAHCKASFVAELSSAHKVGSIDLFNYHFIPPNQPSAHLAAWNASALWPDVSRKHARTTGRSSEMERNRWPGT